MNNRKELLMQKVQAAGAPLDADRKAISDLIEKNPELQRMLCGVLQWSDEALNMMANVDLSDDKGVKIGIKLQARASALAAFVDELLTFATTIAQPETKKEETQ